MSEIAFGLLLFLNLAACGPAKRPAAPTLEEIVEHRTRARGGREAVSVRRLEFLQWTMRRAS